MVVSFEINSRYRVFCINLACVANVKGKRKGGIFLSPPLPFPFPFAFATQASCLQGEKDLKSVN